MKYKVGDLVRIVGPEETVPGWVSEMDKFIGEVARINGEYTEDRYFLKNIKNSNGHQFWFLSEWLEPALEDDSFVRLWQ